MQCLCHGCYLCSRWIGIGVINDLQDAIEPRLNLDRISAGDVLVADSYFCVWWLLAELRHRRAHGAFRLHQTRHADFTTGRILGPNDHIVTWTKPALCQIILNAIASHRVGNRPNRYEPRKVKRRAKGYSRMLKPRAEERAACLTS